MPGPQWSSRIATRIYRNSGSVSHPPVCDHVGPPSAARVHGDRPLDESSERLSRLAPPALRCVQGRGRPYEPRPCLQDRPGTARPPMQETTSPLRRPGRLTGCPARVFPSTLKSWLRPRHSTLDLPENTWMRQVPDERVLSRDNSRVSHGAKPSMVTNCQVPNYARAAITSGPIPQTQDSLAANGSVRQTSSRNDR